MIVDEIIKNISTLSQEDKQFLLNIGMNGILRKLLSKDELKYITRLKKLNLIERGISTDKYKNVFYYIDSFVYSRL